MNKLIKSLLIYPILICSCDSTFALENNIEINILMPAPFADSTKALIQEYNKTNNKKVKVNVTRGPMETESMSDLAISNLLLGSNQFDALLIDVTWLPKYASAGWLYSLNSQINKKKWDGLMEGAKIGNEYKNNIYRWPLVADMGLLYWRTDLMDSPPRTFEQLIQISQKLQKNNKVKYGYVWQGRQYEGLSCVYLEVIKGYGGNWIDKQGKVRLNSLEGIKAATWLSNLITMGVSPKSVTNFSENESLQVFESGQSAFMRNWPYAWSELQKDKSKVQGKVGVTTMVSLNRNSSTAALGSWGFSILNNSRHKKETLNVIEFLTSENSQKELFINYGYTPISKIIYENKNFKKKYPILHHLKKGLESTQSRPMTPLYAQLSNVLQRQLSALLTGKLIPIEAMNKAQSNTLSILRSAGEIK